MTDEKKPAPMGTVNVATAAGVAGGGGAAVVITWLSTLAETKYGIPAPVASVVLGGLAGVLVRIAAKLNPT